MEVQIINSQSMQALDLAKWHKIAEEILVLLNCKENSELSLSFVDNAQIQKLNLQYRNNPDPTDVLAFAFSEGQYAEINPNILGDVVISIEQAILQAQELGHSFETELKILLIHGILHLLGHDDEDEQAATAMERQTSQILRALSAKNIDFQ